MVMVVEALGQHRRQRPPPQHRHLRAEQLRADLAHLRHFHVDAREALDQRDVAERVGGALRLVGVVGLDRALQLLGLAQHEHDQHREDGAQGHQQQRHSAS